MTTKLVLILQVNESKVQMLRSGKQRVVLRFALFPLFSYSWMHVYFLFFELGLCFDKAFRVCLVW